jgi:hypothetical protein
MADQKPRQFGSQEKMSLEPEAKPRPIAPGAKKAEGESISLEQGEEADRPSAVKTYGSGAVRAAGHKADFKRPPNLTGQGATRCRIFFTKIAPPALEYMESQINDWLDSEEIEVKEVGHIIGNMVTKTVDPNLIVMVWY